MKMDIAELFLSWLFSVGNRLVHELSRFGAMLEEFSMIYLTGFGYNILLTVLSCIIPVLFGVFWILISKTHIITHRIVKFVYQFGECIVPMLIIIVGYYGVPHVLSILGVKFAISSLIACVIGFNICFLGFLPARQKSEYSIIKNILVNTTDLVATVFMWTLITSIIAVPDMVFAAKVVSGSLYMYFEAYLIPLVISFAVLAVLKGIKYIFEEFLK